MRCKVIVTKRVGLELYARAGYCLVIGTAYEGDEEICRGLYICQ